jgi:hypothetical protein
VPKRSNPTQLLLTGLIGFGVQRSADSSGPPPKAENPDQMPMQPGSSNTPQLRKIKSQQDQKQATPTKIYHEKKQIIAFRTSNTPIHNFRRNASTPG